MPNTQPAPFGELLTSAWALVKERMNVLFPGVIIFTVLSALTQIPLMGFEEQSAPSPENIGIAVAASIVSILIGVIAYLYYLIAVTGGDQSVGTIIKKTLPRFFPFIGLSILILLRTFAWLIFAGVLLIGLGTYATFSGNEAGVMFMPLGVLLFLIGIICGLIFGPRYMLSPILWVVEGQSVNASMKRSYDVSRGYWGKILGNTLLLALIFMVIMIGVGIVSSIIGGILGAMAGVAAGGLFAGMLTMFFSQFYNVVLMAFLLKLSATIIVNPRSGPAAPAAPVAPAAPTAPKPVKAAASAPAASKKPAVKAQAKKAPAKKPAAKKAAPKKKKA